VPDQRPSATTRWRKSSFSAVGECVEVAVLDDGRIGVRDSKDPGGGMLAFTRAEIDAFVKGAQAGEFDDFR
jgi:Domain of unknown function (DUF397)